MGWRGGAQCNVLQLFRHSNSPAANLAAHATLGSHHSPLDVWFSELYLHFTRAPAAHASPSPRRAAPRRATLQPPRAHKAHAGVDQVVATRTRFEASPAGARPGRLPRNPSAPSSPRVIPATLTLRATPWLLSLMTGARASAARRFSRRSSARSCVRRAYPIASSGVESSSATPSLPGRSAPSAHNAASPSFSIPTKETTPPPASPEEGALARWLCGTSARPVCSAGAQAPLPSSIACVASSLPKPVTPSSCVQSAVTEKALAVDAGVPAHPSSTGPAVGPR